MAVNMVPQFMTHDKKQFLLRKRLQQRRREHDVHTSILGLETGGIELGRRIHIELQAAFNAKTLLAPICHFMQRSRHGAAKPHRSTEQMPADPGTLAILFLLFYRLTHPTHFRMGKQLLV